MPEAVVVATARSPIGRAFKGSLTQVRPDDLAATIVRAVLDKVPASTRPTSTTSTSAAPSPGASTARTWPGSSRCSSASTTCPGPPSTGSARPRVQTTRMAFHAIKAGEGDVFVSAGVECVSRYKGFGGAGKNAAERLGQPGVRAGQGAHGGDRLSNETWHDPRADGTLPDIYMAMGQTAENVATLRGVSRRAQDEWGVESQNRAEKANADGFFEREITPVTLPDGSVMTKDDSPRAGVTLEGVSGLQPVFRPGGTVTAGNCCPLNDGAAALVVMSDTKAQELDLTPLARVVATGVTALSPEIMGLGPVEASKQALRRAGMSIADMDLVEINEAFAAQVLPSADDLGIDHDKLNVHGGAIALGPPLRHDRCQDHHHAAQRPAGARRPVRPRDDVRRRRPGHGDHLRAAQLTR